MIKNQLVVYIKQDEDGMFVGSIPSIPSCHAQGETQGEMIKNLTEVVKLCTRNINSDELEYSRFVGIQNLDLTHA